MPLGSVGFKVQVRLINQGGNFSEGLRSCWALVNMSLSPKRAEDINGATPLSIAAQNGYPAAAKFLLQYKAEVDKALNTDATPMYVAAHNGHSEVVSVLVESKAKLDAQTTDGATPLFIAFQMGHYGDLAAQNGHADVVTAGPGIGPTK